MEVAHLSLGSFGDVVVRNGLRHQARLDLRALRTVKDYLMGHDRRQRLWAEAHHRDRQRKITPGHVSDVLHELLSQYTHRSRSIVRAWNHHGNERVAGTKSHGTRSSFCPVPRWLGSHRASNWWRENTGHQRFGVGTHDRPNVAPGRIEVMQ